METQPMSLQKAFLFCFITDDQATDTLAQKDEWGWV